MNRRRFQTQLESLEPLTLLSGSMTVEGAVDVVTTFSTKLHLAGTLSGTFRWLPAVDTGPAYSFTVEGTVSPLGGEVSASGSLGRSGFILLKNRPVGGFITLATHQGTLTLSLSSSDQRSYPFGIPPTLTYRVTGATGIYVHYDWASPGTVKLTLKATPGAFPTAGQITFTIGTTRELDLPPGRTSRERQTTNDRKP